MCRELCWRVKDEEGQALPSTLLSRGGYRWLNSHHKGRRDKVRVHHNTCSSLRAQRTLCFHPHCPHLECWSYPPPQAQALSETPSLGGTMAPSHTPQSTSQVPGIRGCFWVQLVGYVPSPGDRNLAPPLLVPALYKGD